MARKQSRSSRASALRALVNLAPRHGRPLTADEMPGDLYEALLHHFGAIEAARAAARLPAPPRGAPRKWTRERVIAELRRLHRSGVAIRASDLRRIGRAELVSAVHNYAGGFPRARRLARMPDPARPIVDPERWDEDRVLEEIWERDRRGKPLSLSKAPRKLAQAARRYFGGWRQAIEVADLDYDKIRLKRAPYTKKEVLVALRDLARKRPRMTRSQLVASPIGQACLRQFASLEIALRRAELVRWPARLVQAVMSKQEVKRALIARHRARKPLTSIGIARDDLRLTLAIRRHYQSIYDAVAAAGLTSESQIQWSREEVIAQLLRRHAEGLPMSSTAVERDMQMLTRSARKYFGSFASAMRAAGLRFTDGRRNPRPRIDAPR